MTSLLSVSALDAFYGDFQALFGIDFELQQGEAVAVIGANGAGKSTLLKSLAGLVRNRPDAIRFAGRDIGDSPAANIVRFGLALVPEGRQLFPSLTVEENLLIGAYGGEENAKEDPVMVASNVIAKPVRGVGGFYAMALDTFVAMVKPPFAWREFISQSWFVARVSIVREMSMNFCS